MAERVSRGLFSPCASSDQCLVAPTELNSSDEEDFNEVDEREGSYTEATERTSP